METMVLCSAAKGITSSFSLQPKHISDNQVYYCRINNHHPFCRRQTKGFSYGLRFRTDSPLRSATSDEATQTTSYVKEDESETAKEETSNVNDESKPVTEPETTSETTPESKLGSETEANSQPESYLKEESEPEPEPEPEPVAITETAADVSEEAEPKPEPEPVSAVTAEVSSTGDTQIKAEVPQDSLTSVESFDLFKILEDAGIKFDSEDKYSVYVLGASGVIALWIASTILRAFDSIPVLPKVLELVGIGYTVWFSYRNLIFEEKRKELFGKIEQIKQQVFGSEED